MESFEVFATYKYEFMVGVVLELHRLFFYNILKKGLLANANWCII